MPIKIFDVLDNSVKVKVHYTRNSLDLIWIKIGKEKFHMYHTSSHNLIDILITRIYEEIDNQLDRIGSLGTKSPRLRNP